LAPRSERGDEFHQLRTFVGRGIVELEHLAHLREGEPQALAAQDELQAHVVALGIDAASAVAARRGQALVLVEADPARRDVGLAREIADRALVVYQFGGVGRHNLREFAPGNETQFYRWRAPAERPGPVNPESILEYPRAAPPAGGETLEIAPGVHWARMPLPFALDHINLWLL